ncbi:hypothetical protein KO495_12890 [Colwellia sp. D2M02]|uniref:hypothetical protein n=1 Tax=Colwellia sp. D2M02 TaxID=2841562 RepID=UPI001C0937D5|nr:hypothetical protein [Colwellia sp. D2M02]MBU2894210.1 hypothetical protein [Colwellia sp. D2M02]
MEHFLYIALAPWLVFVVFGILANLLIKWAKKRRGIAVAFGIFVQMFTPDPMVENTIKVIQVERRIVKEETSDKVSAKKQ